MRIKLKLVRSTDAVKRQRNVMVIIHRCSQHAEDRTRNMTRRYSSVANAFMRMTSFVKFVPPSKRIRDLAP